MTRRDAFTLLELLVTTAIIAVLGLLTLAGARGVKSTWEQTIDLSNLRAIGGGCGMYAADNNMALPRVSKDADSWTRMIWHYIPNEKLFASPSDPRNCLRTKKPIYALENNTSYVMNGFSDLGDYSAPSFAPRVSMVDKPGSTILVCLRSFNAGDRYLDLAFGDHKTVGDYRRYNNGSVYLMVDGSSRRIRFSDYDHALWLAKKDWKIP